MTATQPITQTPYTVLITDDDPGCRESLREVFEPEGYETQLASCGREAIEIVRRKTIHVAIMDMHMPDMSGMETVRVMRSVVSRRMPSILISAELSRELQARAVEQMFDRFFAKPLNMNIMRRAVNQILRRYYGML